jgi:hypothetical protein
MSDVKLYKVLDSLGRSQNGGDLQWSLPGTEPGEWHEVTGRVVVCARGLHLTSDPVKWWKPGARIFLAEGDGECSTELDSDKRAFARARLVRECSADELAAVRIYTNGVHEILAGNAIALDSASVTAYGSASVTAYGSASVTAYDSASVTAYGSASVTAYGSASVTAYDSASVTAYGSASVTAYGSASVRAYDSASVRAYDSASVRAYDSANIMQVSGPSIVTLEHGSEAVRIDRRNPRVRCYRAKAK